MTRHHTQASFIPTSFETGKQQKIRTQNKKQEARWCHLHKLNALAKPFSVGLGRKCSPHHCKLGICWADGRVLVLFSLSSLRLLKSMLKSALKWNIEEPWEGWTLKSESYPKLSANSRHFLPHSFAGHESVWRGEEWSSIARYIPFLCGLKFRNLFHVSLPLWLTMWLKVSREAFSENCLQEFSSFCRKGCVVITIRRMLFWVGKGIE